MVHISLRAEELFHIGSFPVTNALLMSFLAFVLLVGGAYLLRRKIALIPGKAQGIAELVLEAILDLMDSVLGDRHKSEKYLPLVATIFLFVMCSNWLGLLPGVGSIFLEVVEDGHIAHAPLFRSAAADLNFTLALGILAVISINLFGILAIGIRKHAGKFFDFSNPINFFVGILELVSEFAKIISFSFRLFGNVFAGEVLLTIVVFLVPYVIPLPFLFLETFVGFIQAFVFAMLALVFIAIATVEHGAEEHH
jgi:F-type H+-transporting ATPase subunit a